MKMNTEMKQIKNMNLESIKMKSFTPRATSQDKDFVLSLTIVVLMIMFLSSFSFASTSSKSKPVAVKKAILHQRAQVIKKVKMKPIICNSEALLNDIQNYRLGLNTAAEHHKTEGMGVCLYRRYIEMKARKEAEAKKSLFKKAPKNALEYVNLIQKDVERYSDKRVTRNEICDIDEGAEIYQAGIEKCRDTGMEIKRLGAITDDDI